MIDDSLTSTTLENVLGRMRPVTPIVAKIRPAISFVSLLSPTFDFLDRYFADSNLLRQLFLSEANNFPQ